MNEGIKIPSVTITPRGSGCTLRFASRLNVLERASLARTEPIGNGERELLEFCGEVDADQTNSFRQ